MRWASVSFALGLLGALSAAACSDSFAACQDTRTCAVDAAGGDSGGADRGVSSCNTSPDVCAV